MNNERNGKKIRNIKIRDENRGAEPVKAGAPVKNPRSFISPLLSSGSARCFRRRGPPFSA